MRLLKALYASLFCLLLGQTIFAQLPSIVTGHVTDASGAGIPEVKVEAITTCNGDRGTVAQTRNSTTTNERGEYSASYIFGAIPPPPSRSCALVVQSVIVEKTGLELRQLFYSRTNSNTEIRDFVGTPPSVLSIVSAADYNTTLSSESIAAAFGTGLASITASASTLPLPTTLGDVRVSVQGYNQAEQAAALFFVSPTQINYLLPAGLLDNSIALVKISSGAQLVAASFILINQVAPAIFTADASGHGLPAAVVLRIKSDGTQSYEAIGRFDPNTNKFIPIPIDLGAETDRVFLVLFGTGWRNRTPSTSSAGAYIADIFYEASFAGAHPTLVGVDQLNLLLPHSLAGRGEVAIQITVGAPSNRVSVNIR